VKTDAGGLEVEVRVDEATIFPRIDTVTGVCDKATVLARPGQPSISNRRRP
jgi:hypothetical protein